VAIWLGGKGIKIGDRAAAAGRDRRDSVAVSAEVHNDTAIVRFAGTMRWNRA